MGALVVAIAVNGARDTLGLRLCLGVGHAHAIPVNVEKSHVVRVVPHPVIEIVDDSHCCRLPLARCRQSRSTCMGRNFWMEPSM